MLELLPGVLQSSDHRRYGVGSRRWDEEEEDGVRHRRQRVHRVGAGQDAAGEGIRREDDGQKTQYVL